MKEGGKEGKKDTCLKGPKGAQEEITTESGKCGREGNMEAI